MPKYEIGAIIECVVTGIENYGIFVNIDSNYNGLVHISEISKGFVRNINDYITIGEKIYAEILEIDEQNFKIKLSIKNIDYKHKDNPKIVESPKGFEPLASNLQNWTDEKLREIDNSKEDNKEI